MTEQELADWMRDCPEEHREMKIDSIIYPTYCYDEAEQNKPCGEDILIRRNHDEWEEPIIEENN